MNVFHHAKSIVATLTRAGYTAYFAGGWVRDFVMGHPSEDIDIATDASPSEVMDLFTHTLLVGLAFGVVIIVIEGHQFEVATFRKDLTYVDGRHPQGIELSNPREDALRRDFTINGMFYDPLEGVIHDFVQGQEDIRHRMIRTIGNPHERFFEDRLRMLRAFRFSARFGFAIDLETQQAIRENAEKLFPSVAMERVWQELNKMSAYPRFDQAIVDMHRLDLLDVIFPEITGMHIKDLRQIVAAYAHFPPNCPTILYLISLFPAFSTGQKIEIAKRIKASNRDVKLIEFIGSVHSLVRDEEEGRLVEPYQWVYKLAHPDYELAIQVLAAFYSDDQRQHFLNVHQQRMRMMLPHIKRIQDRTPLISAALLKEEGIKPGKSMGRLLKEAEQLSVNKDCSDPARVLSLLKQSTLWTQVS